jgi:hypothetical protein
MEIEFYSNSLEEAKNQQPIAKPVETNDQSSNADVEKLKLKLR